jgi:Asp-tRNA(Asn)/Glu-tRNA(Gln) amidotransferase A subunit family amidase
MSNHTENRIWGVAKNPFDNERSCGGSSGGESGLIGANCVPFGIGSDIGGSIRVPCLFTGIAGFKPTNWRLSSEDTAEGTEKDFNMFT